MDMSKSFQSGKGLNGEHNYAERYFCLYQAKEMSIVCI